VWNGPAAAHVKEQAMTDTALPEPPASSKSVLPGELRIDSVRQENTVVLTLTGEIDTATAPQLLSAADAAIASRPTILVLDLGGVSFLASAGLTAMVLIQRQAAPEVGLHVVASTRTTLRPLQITELDQQLSVFASLDDAFKAADTSGGSLSS
jgi:anti-sigma B factor antagonist